MMGLKRQRALLRLRRHDADWAAHIGHGSWEAHCDMRTPEGLGAMSSGQHLQAEARLRQGKPQPTALSQPGARNQVQLLDTSRVPYRSCSLPSTNMVFRALGFKKSSTRHCSSAAQQLRASQTSSSVLQPHRSAEHSSSCPPPRCGPQVLIPLNRPARHNSSHLLSCRGAFNHLWQLACCICIPARCLKVVD